MAGPSSSWAPQRKAETRPSTRSSSARAGRSSIPAGHVLEAPREPGARVPRPTCLRCLSGTWPRAVLHDGCPNPLARLGRVELTSEDDLIIGDHVMFLIH